ncbi:MAG: phosphotransferase family protein [Anaerolineae bacterium]
MTQDTSPIPPSFLQHPEFIQDYVWPVYAHGSKATAPAGWEVEVAQSRRTGRVTAGYRLDEELRFFAKFYADGAEGSASYYILRTLWKQGFGAESPYRVSEPLGYLPEHGVLLMRAAEGECLLALQAHGWETWKEGLRGAARWLAALHASPVRQGPPEDVGQGVFRLARRIAKTAARKPEAEKLLICLVKDLAGRAAAIAGPRSQVQTHGDYHASHVFLAPENVTVIDLDRSCPADPAKDVAKFLHRLRAGVAKHKLDYDTAERATSVFLEEYTRHSPADLSGLAYYWSYSILSKLLYTIRRCHLDEDIREQRVDFYRAEFYDIPRRLESGVLMVRQAHHGSLSKG